MSSRVLTDFDLLLPASLDEALDVLVKWAVRASTRDESGAVKAPKGNGDASNRPED